jgi:4-hydroxyphenylpyruvate dioxygenase-like putative hemolysin
MTAAMAPMSQLNATDLCDRCGAQAYVRVVLPGSGQLLFCAHHARQHGEALAKVAVEIQDETERLARSENSGTSER